VRGSVISAGSRCPGVDASDRLFRVVAARVATVFAVLALLACAGCEQPSPGTGANRASGRTPHYRTVIRWTAHGIPHVRASDSGSLGYGLAYANARAGFCSIARELVRVNGNLSRYLGIGDGRRESDLFHRYVLSDAAVREFLQRQADHHVNLFAGFAAGYNRWLRDHRQAAPAACRNAPWLRPIVTADVARLVMSTRIERGLGRFQQAIANAAPPDATARDTRALGGFPPAPEESGNAVAVGKALSMSGRALLLGNTYAPWEGAGRLHVVHATIPGEFDVMGATTYASTRLIAGFNQDIAWTHAGSRAQRFTLYALTLHPAHPTRYQDGGRYREMTRTEIRLPVRDASGTERTETHAIYASRQGPLLVTSELPWTATRAFAIRDVNLANDRADATYEALYRARSAGEVENALFMQGVGWSSTVAADRHGSAFYADVGATPNVDAALLARCRVDVPGLPTGVLVLDAANARCAWRDDARSAIPGALPPVDMPRLRRDDFVAQADGGHWVVNPEVRLEGYPATLGPERSPQSFGTRAGLAYVAERAARDGRLDLDDLQELAFAHRSFAAERLLDDLLRTCRGWGHPVEVDGSAVEIRPACEVLATWDRTATVTSRGSHVWREFWREAAGIEGLQPVAFDPADPVGTPQGLAVDDAPVREQIRAALARAVLRLAARAIPLDAPLGDVQYVIRNGERIAVPGSSAAAGAWTAIETTSASATGTSVVHGTSYVQVVGWNSDGALEARGLLASSQSEDPDAPDYADQTRLYAERRWIRLPFREEEIRADPSLKTLTLSE
jgi:acyl-homoserine-lactone acylase